MKQKIKRKENPNQRIQGVFKKKYSMRNLVFVLGVLVMFSSCEDYFDPKLTNERTFDVLLTQPDNVRGLLTYAYRAIPSSYDTFNSDFLDSATDNALSNNLTNNINQMITTDGFWTAVNNPLDNWQARYDDLKNVNLFMEVGLDGTVQYYRSNPTRDETYRQRLKGEAFFLRAYIHFELLKRFGGVDVNGQLMGIPLMTASIDIDNPDLLNLPRNTYQECVQQILDDINTALGAGLPESYTDVDPDFDETNLGRPTTVACRALKSRVLLYAASPAFETSTYAEAAQAAKDVIDVIGATLPDAYSVNNINNVSDVYFNNDESDELIMRRVSGEANGNTNALERSHFPPGAGLEGNGNCNPSQNLVDAFPMANGYPITEGASGYSESDMYANRDPRFYMTIIHNNQSFKGRTIETFQGGAHMVGAPGVTVENATRTGYYLRKWISTDANLVSGNVVNDVHYNAIFRKAEMFLNFAEAANEANGPDDTTYGMSARDAIAEIRRRAGIASGGSDDYLASITTKEAMRELIKNERRIELCFEGHRFFDLRRWEDNLNQPVSGVTITDNGNGTFNFSRSTILTPNYKGFMNYGPIPFNEILRTDNITQNQGW
ncbi:RagB/SusD family nutrient uptake outer membrane protein [Seonamhaeicola marinus]|uniref:RagB/SusD family nutrient uptake outer membrane protein n=1 Tax=Seonamhaeicola marinus TaxID=1912246 RepID=A0A5D0IMU8_9FLAO|nr:RagB/SusD family nutrient uptake outer membrane protein [Seonamhaeicola marinus]TYA84341.1 RagB/SusD family nutrient uptake outer membrane protein [Seonamhaeicola marinus]